MEQLIHRIDAINESVGGSKDDKNSKEDTKKDEFILLKEEICAQEKQIRAEIQERNEYVENESNKNNQKEIFTKSNQIKLKIKDLTAKAARLREIVDEDEQKMKKKNKTSSGLENRKKMCDLIDARIEECSRYLKNNSYQNPRDDKKYKNLLKGAFVDEDLENPPLISFTPGPQNSEFEEIEGIDEWRLQIQQGEKEIDEKLDQTLEGAIAVKQLAKTLSDEYAIEGAMLEEVENKLDKANGKLEKTNEKLKKTMEKVGGGSNCVCNFILFEKILDFFVRC